jgi:hypothetical protein
MATGDWFGHTELAESVGRRRIVIFGLPEMPSGDRTGDGITAESERMYTAPKVSVPIQFFHDYRCKGLIIPVPCAVFNLTPNLCSVLALPRLSLLTCAPQALRRSPCVQTSHTHTRPLL